MDPRRHDLARDGGERGDDAGARARLPNLVGFRMGAWGAKPFENDSALDWLGDLDEVDDLRDTLTAVGDADEYLEVDDGSAAIAAAEIVAAAGDGKVDRLAKDARAWLGKHGKKIADADRALAARAVQRVLAESSELAELWDEGGTDNEWRKDVAGLIARLSGPSGAPGYRPPDGR